MKILYVICNLRNVLIPYLYLNMFTDRQNNNRIIKLAKLDEIRLAKADKVFVNKINVNGQLLDLENLNDDLVNWAEKIIIIADQMSRDSDLKNFSFKERDKLDFADIPYPTIKKTYEGLSGYKIDIYRRFDKKEIKNYCGNHLLKTNLAEIEGNDIPFIFEPIINRINTNCGVKYLTYSVAPRAPISEYFDESKIAEMKNYDNYNSKTGIIIVNDHKNDIFLEESIVFYKALYGKDSVQICENIEDALMTTSNFYMCIRSNIRVVSPFISTLFVTMQNLYMKNDGVGFISPTKVWNDDKIDFLWGNEDAILSYIENKAAFSNGGWDMFVRKNGIVIDRELVEVYDINSPIYSNKDNEKVYRAIEFL